MADENTQDQNTPPADDNNTPPDDNQATPPDDQDNSSTPDNNDNSSSDNQDNDDGLEPEGGVKTPDDDKGDNPDDDPDEDEEKRIGKLVKKHMQPFEDTVYKQTVEGQLSRILTENPEYKPYEAKIRRFVTHPNRAPLIKAGLPVKTVVLEALEPHLQQIGAAKAKAADEKAAKTRVDGSSQRPTQSGKLPDFNSMSHAEIEAYGEKVKRGEIPQVK